VAVSVALLLGPGTPVRGAVFEDLYAVRVEPDPEAQDPRTDAIRRAMAVLLTRITGRQQAAAYPELQDLVANAPRYLDAYDPLSEDEIRVGFIRSAINQALDQRNMPFWGAERPATLLWIASDFGDGFRAELGASEIVGSELLPADRALFDEVTDEILTAADERGLPIVLPELDAEDRSIVRFADVWGGFDRIVANAAERYGVDAVLIARVENTGDGARVHWIVRRGNRRETLTTPRPRMGIDWLADEFASAYTTVGDARLTWVTIRSIKTWADFARARDYLESVSIVESVYPEELAGDELLLRITARGDDARLAQILTLDGQLLADQSVAGLVFVPSWITDLQNFNAP
jgi:hypothetical protein